MDNKITFSHLKRLLTSQPYFVWNDIESLNLEKSSEDKDQHELQMPGVVDQLSFSQTITQVQVRTFNNVNRRFFEFIKKQGRVAWIKPTLKLEAKIEETKRLMRDKSVDIIFEPVFFYDGAYAIPTLFDKRTKKISNLKISVSTKRIDLIKPYWDYQILSKNGVDIKQVSYFVLNTKKYKAFELDFFETFKVNTSTTSRSDKRAKDLNNYVLMRKTKTGNGIDKHGNPVEPSTIYDIVAKYHEFGSKKEPIQFDGIDFYLRKIKEAEKAQFKNKLTIEDNTQFGKNPFMSTIIEYLYPEFAGYNGRFVKNKDILQGMTKEKMFSSSVLLSELKKGVNKINDKESVQEFVSKLDNSRSIWYDFEGFSVPFPTIDGYNPFQQATFQVSIIETDKMKEKNVINKIYDPKTFNYTDFPELINLIYSNKADHYVVFNAGYENPRLMEMAKLLQQTNHPEWQETLEKVEWIIEHTIDLAVPFAAASSNSLPMIMIPELKAKHSIKLIEKFITNNNFSFKNMIKPYKELEIQNGGMAMEAAIHRAIGITGDKEWKEKEVVLKEYCENDVRAMIMVYELLKHLLKNQ